MYVLADHIDSRSHRLNNSSLCVPVDRTYSKPQILVQLISTLLISAVGVKDLKQKLSLAATLDTVTEDVLVARTNNT